MPCKHERIQTWRLTDGEPAGMWSCADCAEKFLPISQAWAEKHAAVRKCVEIAEHERLEDPECCADDLAYEAAITNAVDAIRAEYPQAFTDPEPKG